MAFYIPALVIQRNNTVFIATTGVTVQKSGGSEILAGIGLSTEIPTAEGGAVPDGDYWAIPTADSGIVSSFTYLPYNANDPIGSIQPNIQAFKVCRIMNTLASDYWYIVGTVAQYITADGGAALPTTITTLVGPCQDLGGIAVACSYHRKQHEFTIFPIWVFQRSCSPGGGKCRVFYGGSITGIP